MTYYGRWTYKFEEAARQGAAAALIVHDTFPAAYGWNVVESSSWTGPQAYAAARRRRRRPDAGQRLGAEAGRRGDRSQPPGKDLAQLVGGGQAAGLQAGAARRDRLDRVRQRDPPLRLEERRSACCRAASGPTNTCSTPRTGTISAAAPPTPRATTSATARSTTPPAPRRWSRSAEAHAKAGPAARTLVFLAVTAEESGLLGSEYYARQSGVPARADGRRASTWTRCRWPGRRAT